MPNGTLADELNQRSMNPQAFYQFLLVNDSAFLQAALADPALISVLLQLDKTKLLELGKKHFTFAKFLVDETLKPTYGFSTTLVDLGSVFITYLDAFKSQYSKDIISQIAIKLMVAHGNNYIFSVPELLSLLSIPAVARFIISSQQREYLLKRYANDKVRRNKVLDSVEYSQIDTSIVKKLLEEMSSSFREPPETPTLIRMVFSSQDAFNFTVDSSLRYLSEDAKIEMLKRVNSSSDKLQVTDDQKSQIESSVDIGSLTSNNIDAYLQNCSVITLKTYILSEQAPVYDAMRRTSIGKRLSYSKKAGVLIEYLDKNFKHRDYAKDWHASEYTAEISDYLAGHIAELTDEEINCLITIILRNEKMQQTVKDLALKDERCAKQLLLIPNWDNLLNPNWGNRSTFLMMLHNKFDSIKALIAGDRNLTAILDMAVKNSARSEMFKAPKTNQLARASNASPELATSAEYDYVFKVFLVGDLGVGKTSLIERYCDDFFNREDKGCMRGVENKTRTLEYKDKTIKLQVWDIGNNEYCDGLLKGMHIILIVYDVTDQVSFNNIKQWLQGVDRYASEDVIKILVGNKSDLQHKKVVDCNAAREFAESKGIDFIEVSAKENANVDETFELAVKNRLEQLSPKREDNLPTVHVGEARPVRSDGPPTCVAM